MRCGFYTKRHHNDDVQQIFDIDISGITHYQVISIYNFCNIPRLEIMGNSIVKYKAKELS